MKRELQRGIRWMAAWEAAREGAWEAAAVGMETDEIIDVCRESVCV